MSIKDAIFHEYGYLDYRHTYVFLDNKWLALLYISLFEPLLLLNTDYLKHEKWYKSNGKIKTIRKNWIKLSTILWATGRCTYSSVRKIMLLWVAECGKVFGCSAQNKSRGLSPAESFPQWSRKRGEAFQTKGGNSINDVNKVDKI